MRQSAAKFAVIALLALCAVIYVAELSGRWDQTIRDANDEAAVVAVVLCIGISIEIARIAIVRGLTSTPLALPMFLASVSPSSPARPRAIPRHSAASPPLRLRI